MESLLTIDENWRPTSDGWVSSPWAPIFICCYHCLRNDLICVVEELVEFEILLCEVPNLVVVSLLKGNVVIFDAGGEAVLGVREGGVVLC